jgi:murein DD-endopeptidase MepM/ murein hydrolase activator NlpD
LITALRIESHPAPDMANLNLTVLTEDVSEPDEPALPAEATQTLQPVETVPTAFPTQVPPEPLRLVFPTAGLQAESAWRPALYPIPWALTAFDHFYFSRPIAADQVNWPLPDYRYGGVFFEDIVHSGVDISVPEGTPVLAAAPGKIAWAGYGLFSGAYDENDPYGIAVLVRHSFGHQGAALYTVYAHLSQVEVAKGQPVETGQAMGLSGQTGETTGPHLHFEIRLEKDGVFFTRNPELWLVPPQGWGVLAGEVMNNGGVRLEQFPVILRSRANGQSWSANTYAGGNANSDPYYRENLVISDLPAGSYDLEVNYLGKKYTQEVHIQPGLVAYFTFHGRSGFNLDLPPLPGREWQPPG